LVTIIYNINQSSSLSSSSLSNITLSTQLSLPSPPPSPPYNINKSLSLTSSSLSNMTLSTQLSTQRSLPSPPPSPSLSLPPYTSHSLSHKRLEHTHLKNLNVINTCITNFRKSLRILESYKSPLLTASCKKVSGSRLLKGTVTSGEVGQDNKFNRELKLKQHFFIKRRAG